jgi:voltage-gated potassium channel
MRPMQRLRWAALTLLGVAVLASLGYWLLFDFGLLDAVYQTVTTITTVGFREVEPLSGAGQVFTILVILFGAGTALYTFGATFEVLLEGDLSRSRRRRRMDREIDRLSDHVIVCGWGRVGRSIAANASRNGLPIVIVDRSPERLGDTEHLHVVGDATDDAVLLEAGLARARALIAAIDTDADNLYVALSGRSLRPDLFIIARARDESSEAKLRRAGANRVVNPQAIGGARMAAFAAQPHVAEFLDVMMHQGEVEFRLEEVAIGQTSPLAGLALDSASIRESTGALILALRHGDGSFVRNPPTGTRLRQGHVLIAMGTPDELAALTGLATGAS